MAEPLGGVGEEIVGLRIDRFFRGGVLEHMFRRVVVRRHQESAAEEDHRLTAVLAAHRLFERTERLAQRDPVACTLRVLEPHSAQRDVGVAITRIAFGGSAEREDCALLLPDARVGQTEVDLTRRARVERRERLELHQTIVHATQRPVQVRELFASGKERGLDGHRLLQRDARFVQPVHIAQAEAEEVIRLREPIVLCDRFVEGLDRARGADRRGIERTRVCRARVARGRPAPRSPGSGGGGG